MYMKTLSTFSFFCLFAFMLCLNTETKAQISRATPPSTPPLAFSATPLGGLGTNIYEFVIDPTTLPVIMTPIGLPGKIAGYKFFWNFGDGDYKILRVDEGDPIPPVYHIYPKNDPSTPVTSPLYRYKPKVKVTLMYTADKDPLSESTKQLVEINNELMPPQPMDISMGDSLVRIEAVREPVPGELVTFIVSYMDATVDEVEFDGAGVVNYAWDSDMAFEGIEYYHDEKIQIQPPFGTVGPAEIRWEYTGMAPGEIRNVFLTFRTQDLPTGEVGDTIVMNTQMRMAQGRIGEDTAIYNFKIHPSHDPNSKVVSPKIFSKNKEKLTYTIYFQNEGKGPARYIEINDNIDPKLDISTFKMQYMRVGQGEAKDEAIFPTYHGFRYKVHLDPANRTVQWILDPVYLPGVKDPEGTYGDLMTSGEIVYTMETECIDSFGVEIPNQAEIIFDTNDPMMTDTAIATRTCCMERVWNNGRRIDLREHVTGLEGEIDPNSINIIHIASKDAENPPEIYYHNPPYLEYYPKEYVGMDEITYKVCDVNGNCTIFTLVVCINMREDLYPCVNTPCASTPETIDITDRPLVKTYPNPFQNYLKLDYRDNLRRIRKLELVNFFGTPIMNIPVSRTGKAKLNTSRLFPGLYFLRINDIYVQKVKKVW